MLACTPIVSRLELFHPHFRTAICNEMAFSTKNSCPRRCSNGQVTSPKEFFDFLAAESEMRMALPAIYQLLRQS